MNRMTNGLFGFWTCMGCNPGRRQWHKASRSQLQHFRRSTAETVLLVFGGKSLLQHTRERLELVFPASNTLLVPNRAHEIYYQRQFIGRVGQPYSRTTIESRDRSRYRVIGTGDLEARC
jgi:hypothetical protein